MAWTQRLRQTVSEEIVAMDGKALRRAIQTGGVPYMVNAWAVRNGLVLGQLRVEEKSNEITAIPPLLRALDLAGWIVTLDAMGLPEEHRPRDHRSRCRVCAGTQRQPRHGPRRSPHLP